MGASVAVDPAVQDPMEAWTAADGRRVPIVFDAIGVPGSLEAVIKAAPGAMGRVCIVGSCMQTDSVRPLVAQVKQLTVVFSMAYDPFEFGDTLRAIAEGEIDVTPMITGTCGIDGVPAVVRRRWDSNNTSRCSSSRAARPLRNPSEVSGGVAGAG